MPRKTKATRATIYKLLDPITLEPRYVGCTINPQRRYREHLRAEITRDDALAHWVRGLRLVGLAPIFKVIQEVPTAIAETVESFWIIKYSRPGYQILNTSGVPR